MREKLEAKINEILEYIISKNVTKITHDDYAILSAELQGIRFRESEVERNEKFAETMAGLIAPLTYSPR